MITGNNSEMYNDFVQKHSMALYKIVIPFDDLMMSKVYKN